MSQERNTEVYEAAVQRKTATTTTKTIKERNETCALFSLVVVQQPASRPACSCKDIREAGNSKGDGKYWIDPENSGNPLKVYCDMTTDGGSWLVMFYETFF